MEQWIEGEEGEVEETESEGSFRAPYPGSRRKMSDTHLEIISIFAPLTSP